MYLKDVRIYGPHITNISMYCIIYVKLYFINHVKFGFFFIIQILFFKIIMNKMINYFHHFKKVSNQMIVFQKLNPIDLIRYLKIFPHFYKKT